MSLTKAEQEERWAKCIKYLGESLDLPSAQAAGKKAGFGCGTAVWIGALGKMLASGRRPGDQIGRRA